MNRVWTWLNELNSVEWNWMESMSRTVVFTVGGMRFNAMFVRWFSFGLVGFDGRWVLHLRFCVASSLRWVWCAGEFASLPISKRILIDPNTLLGRELTVGTKKCDPFIDWLRLLTLKSTQLIFNMTHSLTLFKLKNSKDCVRVRVCVLSEQILIPGCTVSALIALRTNHSD